MAINKSEHDEILHETKTIFYGTKKDAHVISSGRWNKHTEKSHEMFRCDIHTAKFSWAECHRDRPSKIDRS